ncbi:hypothetical protein I7I48_09398 [Histoplasma ohiense]|nr:hypothetical protein I7I48_09398 [Histoplasma ohiense (nom. inval.)]
MHRPCWLLLSALRFPPPPTLFTKTEKAPPIEKGRKVRGMRKYMTLQPRNKKKASRRGCC